MKRRTETGHSETFEERRERFAGLCERDLSSAKGFGTFREKQLHAVLKNFYCADPACQEVPLTLKMCRGDHPELTDVATRRSADAPVADILTEDGEIIEIQTGSLYPLQKKIHFYLCATDKRVTVVHPIVARKWLRSMDPSTGEVGRARRSPRRGSIRDIAGELYWMAAYLPDRRFTLRVPLIEAEEIKKPGRRYETRKIATVPIALIDEVTFEEPADYVHEFLPPEDELPSPFTAAEYARATGIRGKATYAMLGIFCDLGFLASGEARGRAGTWKRIR